MNRFCRVSPVDMSNGQLYPLVNIESGRKILVAGRGGVCDCVLLGVNFLALLAMPVVAVEMQVKPFQGLGAMFNKSTAVKVQKGIRHG